MKPYIKRPRAKVERPWNIAALCEAYNGECANAQECAQLALTTKDIEFERWCG